MKRINRRIIGGLSLAMVSISIVFGVYTWNSPKAYVSLDGQASVVYTLNAFQRIIRVDGLNLKGEALLEEGLSRRIENQSIEVGLWETMDAMKKQEYLKLGEIETLVLTTSGKDISWGKARGLEWENLLQVYIDQERLAVKVLSLSLTEEEFITAFNAELSPGRYRILERVKEAFLVNAALMATMVQSAEVSTPPPTKSKATVTPPKAVVTIKKVDGTSSASPQEEDDEEEDD